MVLPRFTCGNVCGNVRGNVFGYVCGNESGDVSGDANGIDTRTTPDAWSHRVLKQRFVLDDLWKMGATWQMGRTRGIARGNANVAGDPVHRLSCRHHTNIMP